MKIISPLLFVLLSLMCLSSAAQAPAFDDLTMVDDEIAETYRSAKNHVFLRSKRGTSGLNKTSSADSIKTFSVKEIVLVFTEVNESAFDEREDANRERWENLLKTYPEFFQPNTTYKSLCQCKIGGDSVSFKKAQGFYIYFAPKAAVAKVEEKKAEEKVAEAKQPEVKQPAEEKSKAGKTDKVAAEKEVAKAEKNSNKEKEAEKEKERVEKEKAEKAAAEESKAAANKEAQETSSGNSQEETTSKPVIQKKAPVGKARRAKDPKACRPACYETGEDELNQFFKTTLVFTRKERKHVKKLTPIVKLSLNVDGSLKKVQVTGEDELLNKKIEGAVNMMNKWNAAVKNGVTVKSEVKITLKYDKESKGLKPFEIVMNPRPGPKCKCASDSEIFGD